MIDEQTEHYNIILASSITMKISSLTNNVTTYTVEIKFGVEKKSVEEGRKERKRERKKKRKKREKGRKGENQITYYHMTTHVITV